jgi:MinD-like ATPase involved in chromosome partitioning or flagellar assembly
MKLAVLSVADGAAWEERLVTAFGRGPHPVEIVRRCVDVVDLLAVAASGQGRAALLAAGLRRLDTDAVDRLHAVGVVAVGVVPRGDTDAEQGLRALGVALVVPDDAEPGVVASVLAEAVRADSPDGSASRHRAERSFADPSTSMPIPPGTAPVPAEEPKRRGSVIAVWGPTGAPGRTTVAVTLADELAHVGAASLLIDADVYGGTVAAMLGLLDESPGLAAACRQLSAQQPDPGALAALSWQLGPRLRVLTGIPLASRWPELRPSAIAPVLAAARELADFVVVDCGFCLETDEELSFDTLAPRRNGATLAVLDDADLILAVGAADPIGMQRLVRGLADLRDTEVPAPVWVVLNRVRDGAVPGDATLELTAALERFAGRSPAALLPADTRSLDGALATGRLLSESDPASAFRREVVELAAGLAGVSAPVKRRRRR